MAEDTIVTDESEETAEVVNPRAAAMNAIAEKVQRDSEEYEEPEEVEEELPEEDVFQEPKKVKVKVNGEEMEVDEDKIYEAGVRTYQKETAADKRLREAAELEARLKEREERLAQMEQEIIAKNNEDPDEVSRKFVESLFDDEEEAAREFSKLHKTVQKLSQSDEQRRKREEERAAKELNSATKHYHEQYSDIAGDVDLHAAFNRRLQEEAKNNPDAPASQLVDKAAELVYEKFGKPEEKEEPENPKEKLVKQPKAASSRRKPPPKEKQKTRSDVLADMRGGRGIQSY